jgi:transcription antitermination factor NusG
VHPTATANAVDGHIRLGAAPDASLAWYALYTRARHEKKVDRLLRLREFEVFLPLVPRESQWHDRRKIVDWPLFPGYVFARFGLKATAQILGTPGVATIVRQDGVPAAISDLEIENVRRLASVVTETGSLPEPTPMVECGQQARISKGPFTGVHGVVVQRRGSGRVLIQIGLDVIGQGIKLEIEESSLQEL